MSAGAAAGAAAAAAAARLRREEEEEMTAYRPEDLEGYEFKILRSTTGRFRKPEGMRAALAEEAEAGWELVEKFDHARIRLKRRISWREKDAHLPWDPYRTYVGISEKRMGLIILAIVFGILAIMCILAALLH
jgi:hypothetical protein